MNLLPLSPTLDGIKGGGNGSIRSVHIYLLHYVASHLTVPKGLSKGYVRSDLSVCRLD